MHFSRLRFFKNARDFYKCLVSVSFFSLINDIQSIFFLNVQQIDRRRQLRCRRQTKLLRYYFTRCARVTWFYSKKRRFENVEIQTFFSSDARILLIYWNSISSPEGYLFSKSFPPYIIHSLNNSISVGYSSRAGVTRAIDVPWESRSIIPTVNMTFLKTIRGLATPSLSIITECIRVF